MNILIDNTGLQNFGACFSKKCRDENAVDDFLQMCIQMVFYDKLSTSILVPQHINNVSEEIISMVDAYDSSIFDAKNRNEQVLELDGILNDIAKYYNTEIDYVLERCKTIHTINNRSSIPEGNSEMLKLIDLTTKAIQTGNTNLIEQLRQETAEKKNDSYFFDIATRNINADGSIMDKIMSFSKKNRTWNNAMALEVISSLRIVSNQVLSDLFSSPYSPAVIRAKAIQQQREILFLTMEKIFNLMNKIEFLPGEIKLPSFENYLLIKGRGNPESILKESIRLRNDFSPVREYINKVDEKLNKVDYIKRLKELNEIAMDICNELKFPKESVIKKTLENVHSLPVWNVHVPVPNEKLFTSVKRALSIDLKKCKNAFSEISNDMIAISNRSSDYYRKILISNCVRQEAFSSMGKKNILHSNDRETENANNQKTQIIIQVQGDYFAGDKIMGSKTTGNNSPITNGNNNVVQSYNTNETKLVNELHNRDITKEQIDELIVILREEEQNTENRTLGTKARNWCKNIKTIGLNVLSNLIFTIIYGLPPA